MDYKIEYEGLKSEFEHYQSFAEEKIQTQNLKIVKLENDINSLYNIVQISNYLNSYYTNGDMASMINDILIGVLGVTHSTFYMMENGEFKIKASNINDEVIENNVNQDEYVARGSAFRINSKEPLISYSNGLKICSVLGVPIKIRQKYIGYIIVEHPLFNYLVNEQEQFLRAICNQVAIAVENSILYRELDNSNKRDPLLGIFNRKYFFKESEKRIREGLNKYAVVMIDLDNFKCINDTYGHQFGDKVLIETTRLIEEISGGEGIFARYGGEELIIFTEQYCDKTDLKYKINFIRSQIEKNNIIDKEVKKRITASFGVAMYPEDGADLSTVIKKADKRLYVSKKIGKNKVTIDD